MRPNEIFEVGEEGRKTGYKFNLVARRLFRTPFFKEQIERKQGNADADRRVGDIEGRPVMAAPVHIEEVDHFAHPHPIDQVADCA